ncbi:hypothetical protein ACFXJ8_17715 [Nonomuraea sp. NPDC059194]|uniref:hypothetical protein n=1 Tax=Nonomuraea sp. NPDC059194 TaxID=3346764 RepID=UPI00369B531A
MTIMKTPVAGGDPALVCDFELAYVTADGVETRVDLADAWAIPLEDAPPVRRYASYKGQMHLPGAWWSATTQSLVGYESWLERDHVMLLDFDQTISPGPTPGHRL